MDLQLLYWTFLASLTVLGFVVGVEGQMRTVYFGGVKPSAADKAFDLQAWLKSTMPTKGNRCPNGTSLSRTPSTAEVPPSAAATVQGPSAAATDQGPSTAYLPETSVSVVCSSVHIYSWGSVRYPSTDRFPSPLQSMTVTAGGTDGIKFLLNAADEILLYQIELKGASPYSQVVRIKQYEAGPYVNLGEIIGHTFWVSLTDSELLAGKNGDSAPLMNITRASDDGIMYITIENKWGDSATLSICPTFM